MKGKEFGGHRGFEHKAVCFKFLCNSTYMLVSSKLLLSDAVHKCIFITLSCANYHYQHLPEMGVSLGHNATVS